MEYLTLDARLGLAVHHLAEDRWEAALPLLRSILFDEEAPSPQRAAAGARLGRHHDAETRSCLHRLLADENPWARYLAACALTEAGSRESVEHLLEALGDDTLVGTLWWEARVSNRAAVALARIGDTRATAALTSWMEARRRELDPAVDLETRLLAIFALAELGDAEALTALEGLVGSEYCGMQAQQLLLRHRDGA